MLVIDSEARSRKFPAKPTCSIQADALHTTQNGEKIPLKGPVRRKGMEVPGSPANERAGSNPASAITFL